MLDKYNDREREAIKQLEQDSWQATTVFEASHPGLLEQFDRVEAKVNGNAEALKLVVEQAWQHLHLCRHTTAWDATPIQEPEADGEDPFKELADCATTANQRLAELQQLVVPKFYIGVRPQAIGVSIFVVSMIVSWLAFRGSVWGALGTGAALGGIMIGVVLTWIYHIGHTRSAALFAAIRQTIANAEKYKEAATLTPKLITKPSGPRWPSSIGTKSARPTNGI